MSRTRSTLINSSVGSIGQLISFFVSFIARTVFVRVLGTTNLGYDSLFSNILNVMSIVDMGLTTALAYALYEPLAYNKLEKASAIVYFFKKIFAIIGCFLLVASFLISPFINFFINIEGGLDFSTIRIIFLLYAINSFSTYFFVDMRTLLSADQKEFIAVLIDTFIKIFTKIAQIIILLIFKSYIIYLIIEIIFMMTSNIIINIYVKRRYKVLEHKKKYLLKCQEKKSIFSNVFYLSLGKLAATGINCTDSLIISKVVGTDILGIYSNYNLLMSAGYSLIDKILTGCTASLGNMFVKSDLKKQEEIIYNIQFVNSALASIMLTCELLLTQKVMRIWMGEKLMLSGLTVIIISINLYLFMSRKNLEIMLQTKGIFRRFTPVKLLEMGINLVISICAASLWGINGVFIGTTISLLLAFVLEMNLLVKKEMKMDIKKYTVNQIFYIITDLSITFLSCFCSNLVSIVGIWGIIVQFMIGILVYCVLFYMVNKNNKQFISINNLFVNLVNRKMV